MKASKINLRWGLSRENEVSPWPGIELTSAQDGCPPFPIHEFPLGCEECQATQAMEDLVTFREQGWFSPPRRALCCSSPLQSFPALSRTINIKQVLGTYLICRIDQTSQKPDPSTKENGVHCAKVKCTVSLAIVPQEPIVKRSLFEGMLRMAQSGRYLFIFDH